MSRVVYNEDEDNSVYLWEGWAKQAIGSKRGQAVLRELEAALLAMPVKRLAYSTFVNPYQGEACALGELACARLMSQKGLTREAALGELHDKTTVLVPTFPWMDAKPTYYREELGAVRYAEEEMKLTYTLAWELQEKNDELFGQGNTPEERYDGVLAWVRKHLKVAA